MSGDKEFLAESRPVVLSDAREQVVDEWGRRAGAALRSPAPDSGVAAIKRRVRNQRIGQVGALAGVVAVVAIGLAVMSRADHSTPLRPGDDIPDTVVVTELHDVNRQEALPLAQRALIARDVTPDGVGHGWADDQDWVANQLPSEAAATISALPGCALLTSVGLLPPTTKSAAAYQQSPDGILQHVFVFATPEDASRAMDVIAGDVYPTCWFDEYDRRMGHYRATMSISEAWDAPPIAPHGDRQVIIGQHETLLHNGFRLEYYFVNAYVQVGRAISLIDPVYVADAGNPLLNVNNDITAATTALTNAFGP
jgi:hypothetical protein